MYCILRSIQNTSLKKEQIHSDTEELLKNEELEPTIQQPSDKKGKKKYLGRINYKVWFMLTHKMQPNKL